MSKKMDGFMTRFISAADGIIKNLFLEDNEDMGNRLSA